MNSQGKLFPVEYINHKWYWVGYTSKRHKLFTTPTRRIARPSVLGLGTKEEPYLEEPDQLQLKEKGRELSQEPSEDEPTKEDTEEDLDLNLPIGDPNIDDDLATVIKNMSTTSSSTTVAHARGGGAVSLPLQNPMLPQGNPMSNTPATTTPQPTQGGSQPLGGGGGGSGGSGGGGGGSGRGGGGGGGGGGPSPAGGQAAQQGAAQPQNNPVLTRLVGTVETFTGDRSKTNLLMKQFGLHRMLNNNNPTITNPFTRVVTRGLRVDA